MLAVGKDALSAPALAGAAQVPPHITAAWCLRKAQSWRIHETRVPSVMATNLLNAGFGRDKRWPAHEFLHRVWFELLVHSPSRRSHQLIQVFVTGPMSGSRLEPQECAML